MKFDDNQLYFLPLGGSGEIGMNLNLYRHQGKWLMVDCGVSFIDNPGIEVIMPDTQFIEEHANDLVGLVLTHAHEDHYGAVPYLWERFKCPIYCTPFTAELLRMKCREHGINPPIHEIPLSGKVDIGPFGIEFVRLTHSIPEPNAIAISCTAGTVLHTGDWKIDPDPMLGEATDIETLIKMGDAGLLALVCDSTNVLVPGHSGSEATAREHLIDLIGKHKEARIIVSCFASNVARMKSIYEAAQIHGRQVGILGRSLYRMDEAARHAGYFDDLPPFHTAEVIADLPPSEGLIICTGSQGEPRAALARIAKGEDRHLRLDEGDVVIFSSREIPGNEEAIARIQNNLVRQGVEVITASEIDIHVSGHPCRDELIQMYQWVRPKILIPVHGEERHMQAQAQLGHECQIPEAVVPFNGSVILLKEGNAHIVEEVPAGKLAVDGNSIIPLYSETIRDRHRMMANGVAVVTIVLKTNGRMVCPPRVLLIGVVQPEEEWELRVACIDAIEEMLDNPKFDNEVKDETIAEAARVACRRVLGAHCGKKAPAHVQIIRT